MGYGFARVATLGENIQRLRRRAGLKTGRSLADAMGVTPPVISKLENDQQGLPESQTLLRLAKVLHCSVDELLAFALKASASDADARASSSRARPDTSCAVESRSRLLETDSDS